MDNDTTLNNNYTLKMRWVMAGAAIYNIVALWMMSGWTSTNGAIFGRYSTGLAVAIGLVVLVGIVWITLSVLFYQKFENILRALPQTYRLSFLVIVGIFSLLWFQQPFRFELLNIIVTNLILLSACMALTLSDKPISTNAIRWLLLAIIVFVFITTFISIMVKRPYSPDEAIWSNIAISFFTFDGLYNRLSFYEPFHITPGIGWITAVYGWLLHNMTFDLQVGRAMQFVIYTMTVGAIGFFGTRLYNYRVGLVAMIIAFFGSAYFHTVDYRPDHFVALGQMLAFGTLISARKSQKPLTQSLLHFFTGLLITLSMQLHAVAIVFAIGLSLFYTGDFIWCIWKERKLSVDCLRPIISFGLGALLGTTIYYIFNILVVGGLETYLSVLTAERGFDQRGWPTLYRWRTVELPLAFAGLAYLLWRRSSEDKLYLVLSLCSLFGTYFDTQGYSTPYRGLFIVPMAVFLVEGFKTFAEQEKWHLRQVAIVSLFMFALIGQRLQFVDWNAVRQTIEEGGIPEHNAVGLARQVAANLQAEDKNLVVVGTHELIWSLHDYKHFYSTHSEGTAQKQRGWEGTQVWDYLQVDVYIEIERRMVTPPGLRAYLERENFQVCEEFKSFSVPVRIYRRDCPENE